MKLSYFAQPVTMPERTLMEAIDWNLQVIRWLDELGFDEFWMGEHFTDVWEPIPAPELVLAQALRETERIKLGPAGHCLAYHHPIALAHRIAMLDHMAQGRYQFGVASGAIPTDMGFYGIDPASGVNREMTTEALQIILKIWTADEPFEFKGKYWTVNYPAPMFDGHLAVHLKPFQKPHMPIAVTGFSPSSGTLRFAGRKGYIPMSLNLSNGFVKTHWDAISAGAAEGGRTASRGDWRILKETLVAETDAEARRLALEGPMARAMREYFLPLLKTIGMLPFLKHDPEVADSDVTVEYLVDHSWLVGSPNTVQEKLEAMYEDVGGFGHLMFFAFDYSQNPEIWRDSLGLFVEEVLPKVAHLDPS